MGEKMIGIFKSDENYNEEVKQYNVVDGFLAFGLFILLYVSYYFLGYLYQVKKIYLGELLNIALEIITIVTVKLRGQKISSVGITKYKLKKTVIVGCITGLLLLLTGSLIPGIIQGREWNSPLTILYKIFYFFIIIGFVEELVFRGFIQTRLHGLIQNEIAVTVVTGILFSLMHIPFQMALYNMKTFQYISNNTGTLLLLFFWHIVFAFLYKKFNSIVTGTLFHGFMDMCNGLFR
jgi:membrane protease YdiL (CAAX protease family)